MDAIILKSDLVRTCGEFVDGLFAGKMGVCALRQTKFLLGGVVEHGTTLVSALAKGLRPDLRILLRETFVRLIPGRPRKRSRHDAFPEQLEFTFS